MEEATTTTPPAATGAASPTPQEAQAARRGRGRPQGAKTRPTPLPETPVGTEPGDPPQDAQQTRKRRSKTVDSGVLAKQLKGIHSLAAKLLPITVNGSLLLELSDTEATQLAEAVAAVAKEYDLALDGKTGAAIQLIAVAAMVYGPRVYAIQVMRTQMRKAQAAAAHADPSVVADQHQPNGAATAATN